MSIKSGDTIISDTVADIAINRFAVKGFKKIPAELLSNFKQGTHKINEDYSYAADEFKQHEELSLGDEADTPITHD